MAKKNNRKHDEEIIFDSDARIGYAEAEDDLEFLKDCYVDFGQIKRALDTEDPGSILLGRTGSGKTAALLRIREAETNTIDIEPQHLSLNFIANSDVLSFFHEIGVNLDLFFQLLWRHVLCIEIINYHYNVRSKSDAERAFGVIKRLLGRDENKKFALEYVSECGPTFWIETQGRIKEIVERFENELLAGVDLSSVGVPINASGASSVSKEQTSEITLAAKKVVDGVQIRKLSKLMDIMAEDIFTDTKRKYFILIDKLDERWVDDSLRYRLIRALIETIKSFRKIRTVKIVICMREDLLERVYKYTRDSGFQEEKYEDFNIPIRWSEPELMDVVDKRISSFARRRFTKEGVGFFDLFPKRYDPQKGTFNYLVQRTQYRPRDIIAFINFIMQAAVGQRQITKTIINKAEQTYSKKRFEALCTEWVDEHPNLNEYIELLRGLPTRFNLSDLTENNVAEALYKLHECTSSPDGVVDSVKDYMNSKTSYDSVRARIVAVLFKVGAIGIKAMETDPVQFSYLSSYVLHAENLSSDTRISVAPMLWRYLGSYRGRLKGDLT